VIVAAGVGRSVQFGLLQVGHVALASQIVADADGRRVVEGQAAAAAAADGTDAQAAGCAVAERVHRVVEMVPIRGRTGIGDVLDVSQFRLEVGDPAPVVHQGANDDDDEQNGDDQAADQSAVVAAGRFAQMALVAHRRVYGDVATLSSESFAADAAGCWMTHEIVVGALAVFHAMRAVVTFRTNFVALGPHPAVRTATLAVVGSTGAVVLASAALRAGNSPRVGRTRHRTVVALPARQAATLSGDVMTFGTVFATVAFVLAGEAVGSFGTGLLATDALVARSARTLAVGRVAQSVSVNAGGTRLSALFAEESIGAGSVAELALPAPVAQTLSVVLTRSVVPARTFLLAHGTVVTLIALCFALDTTEIGFALAQTGDGVAGERVLIAALARLVAVHSELAIGARRTAQWTLVAGAARTVSGDVMTGGSVETVALLLAAESVESCAAGQLAEEALPAGRTLALAVSVGAVAAVLTLALVGAVVTVAIQRTHVLAVVAHVT